MTPGSFTEVTPIEVDPIQIYIGTTWIKIHSDPGGMVAPGVVLAPFVNRALEEWEWQPLQHRSTLVANYSSYDRARKIATFPRYALDKLLTYLEDFKIEPIYVPPVNPKQVKMAMKSSFKPRDNQVQILKFICDPKVPFKTISASCGVGKTVCTIYGIVHFQYPALIILAGLINQWLETFKKFTNVKSHEIYVVHGFDSLRELWAMKTQHHYRPKVVIFSTRTLVLYAVDNRLPYNTLPSYQKFQEEFGFGIKIMDEVHTNFLANVKLDLRSNIKFNIYLSATYMRSSPQGKRIFNTVYPPELLFGNTVTRRHVHVYMIEYTLSIDYNVRSRFKTAKGYMHSKYENYVLKRRKSTLHAYIGVIKTILEEHFLQIKHEGQRCLILCQTRDFVMGLHKELTKIWPKFEIKPYFAGAKDATGKEENLKAMIIISTIKSCGTGRDIKALKTCINTVSFASEPQTLQVFGRLREIPQEDTYFCDLWNPEIFSQQYHKNTRKSVYKFKALSLIDEKLC